MRYFVVAVLAAATQAIKVSNMSTGQASSLKTNVIARTQTLIQTRQFDIPEWASGEYQSQYYQLLAGQATEISENVFNRLEAVDPLPEMCDRAEQCADEISAFVEEELINAWETILINFLDTIDTTETTTTNLNNWKCHQEKLAQRNEIIAQIFEKYFNEEIKR